ncbi:hypothetical protein AURDEDRAFT_128831 [Auricularia subglabra TFB-10046 SS5]|nr:hypothetical protein AURDEDRAFT_128831 [Auricularia subglabra TFB-10046 SS5]
MSDFHFDALLTVHTPVYLPPFDRGSPYLYCWNAALDAEGSHTTVCIAQRVSRDDDTDPHPGGASVQVVGRAKVKQGIVLVDAVSVSLSDTLPGDVHEASAVVVFTGVVLTPDLEPGLSSITIVDLRLVGDENAEDPILTVRCRFDRTTPHLAKIGHLSVNQGLVISGTLVGVVDGHTLVDVHDLTFRVEETPCMAHAATRSSPGLRHLGARACQWISTVLHGGKPFRGTNVATGATESSRADDPAWLAYVNSTKQGRLATGRTQTPTSPPYATSSPRRSPSTEPY